MSLMWVQPKASAHVRVTAVPAGFRHAWCWVLHSSTSADELSAHLEHWNTPRGAQEQ